MLLLDIVIGIYWFDTIDKMTIAKDALSLIEKWIEENGDQNQEIYDFINAHEIEVANINNISVSFAFFEVEEF